MKTIEGRSIFPGRARRRPLAAVALVMLSIGPVAEAEIGPALTGITGRGNDATSVFWSPAGITRLKKPELVVETTFAYKVAKLEVDRATISGGNADKDRELLVIPAFYYAHPVTERWRLGASLSVPGGIGNDYGNSWSGRYLAEEVELDFIALAGVAAYRLSDHWSIGGGPLLMYTDSTSKARVNNLDPQLGDGTVKLDESGAGLGWTLGLMYELNDRTRIGATYRSEIDPDLSGKPKFKDVGPGIQEALRLTGLADRKIDVDFKIPAQLQLGLYHEFSNKLSFTADGIWVNMSRFGINSVSIGSDKTFLDSDFRDMWIGSVGFKYYTRPDLAFSVGALYATSPVSDKNRTIALPLDRTISFGAGLEWQWADDLVLHGTLNYADLGDGDIDRDGGPVRGAIAGSFRDNYAIILDLQLTKRF